MSLLVVRLIPTHQVITAKGYRSNVSRWYERYSESSSRSDRLNRSDADKYTPMVEGEKVEVEAQQI